MVQPFGRLEREQRFGLSARRDNLVLAAVETRKVPTSMKYWDLILTDASSRADCL